MPNEYIHIMSSKQEGIHICSLNTESDGADAMLDDSSLHRLAPNPGNARFRTAR